MTHSISAFRQAQLPDSGAATGEIDIPEMLHPVVLDDLPDAVADWALVLIVHGHDPDNPGKYSSRSEALFAVVNELGRAGCDDATIYSVITNPDYGISASVLEKGGGTDSYAKRQILRARAENEHTWLAEMNAKHFVIESDGGKCVVGYSDYDEVTGRECLRTTSFADFRNRYCNQKVEVGTDTNDNPVMKRMGHAWLDHRYRQQYKKMVFAPGQDTEANGLLNLWRGFAITPVAGDWSLMRTQVVEGLADRDPEAADYILRWAAWAVQHPGDPAEVALVLKGGMGTGKGLFARTLMRMFGPHSLHISNIRHLTGNFNAHLRDTALLFADEAYWPGDKRDEGDLKRLITEPTLLVEPKGKEASSVKNALKVVMASNKDWVVPAGPDERRFAVFDVSEAHAKDRSWFRPIVDQLKNGGREAMLHDLLAMDLAGWHPRQVPQTAALQEQKFRNLSPEAEWYFGILQEGIIPGSHKPCIAFSERLYRHAREAVPGARHLSDRRLGGFLAEQGIGTWSNGAARGWQFPMLSILRQRWEEKYGAVKWDLPGAEWPDGGGENDPDLF